MNKAIEYKVALFLTTIVLLILLSAFFIAEKKGLFEEYFYINFSAKSVDGISKGMPLLYSGFEIGKISTIKLDENGEIFLIATIPTKYSKWINNTSTFTLEKPLIGSTKIIVKTLNLNGEPLDETTKNIAIIDGINELIAKITPVIEKIDQVANNLQIITNKLIDKNSIADMITGDNNSSKTLIETMKNIEQITSNLNTILINTNRSLYDEDGLIVIIKKLLTILNETTANLQKISSNIAESSDDISFTKKEIDIALKNANSLMIEIENKIPFKKKKEVLLP